MNGFCETVPFALRSFSARDDLPKRLKVTYLKSYVGMGTARICLCGEYMYDVYFLDGLFHDHDTYHVSVPEVLMVSVSGGDGQRCNALPPNKRTLQIEYTENGDGNFPTLLPIRKKNHSKLKIMSIQLCTDAQNL